MNAPAIITACILLLIGCLHFYWACGGRWAMHYTIPTTTSQQPTIAPGSFVTFVVAFLLFGAALLIMIQSDLLSLEELQPYVRIGCWICAIVFGIRSIGDFNYLGLFKRVKGTLFAKYDTKLFSPLCIWLSLNFFYVLLR
ncbi:MAG: DUF3995 domain-containing protein [Candidatus Cohnella colombiensis]|uniref:DUF3995 domain-containing protein n=1 Tax=Candidatus Cohnella colombiensis TaxID=3121368 RepID=A0AA95JBU0_9BACL|nr:MAG: DUF3995 domain-containing protein [Cohnella sp.]